MTLTIPEVLASAAACMASPRSFTNRSPASNLERVYLLSRLGGTTATEWVDSRHRVGKSESGVLSEAQSTRHITLL